MSAKKKVMHVLSHTHWDREWYQDFQGYRQRLVFQMDSMMDLLEKRPEFRFFHLDGQTSVLDDYLEVKPQGRRRLEKHIRSGRVLIGPWFVMPDERLVSGESMVRNLVLGHSICRAWGARPMPVGYVTDVFGHVSQFPQILRGFGMDAAMLHRGTSCANEKSEMVWEGADGSEVLLVAIYQYTGYNDFMTFREWKDKELSDYEKTKLGLATTDVLFALDGNDHQPAKWDVPEEISRVNRAFRHIRCIHSSMPLYLRELRRALGRNWTRGRKRFVGELTLPAKEGTWSDTMYGFGSSRFYLKQANDELETLLPRVAEPLHAWALISGGQSQKGFLDRAWRYLLLNHPHDSICGCSLDQVHRDMMYRFDQARLIANQSVWESIQAIADGAKSPAAATGPAALTLFNCASADTGPVTRFTFDIEAEAAAKAASEGLSPIVIGADGREAPLHVLGIEHRVRTRPFAFITDDVEGVLPWVIHKPLVPTPAYRIRSQAVDRFEVEAALSVPAFGHKSWHIEFRPRKTRLGGAARRGVRADALTNTIQNDVLKVTVAPDGTLDILDRPTGVRYAGLHVFEDCGDAGEGWNHRYPEKDRRVYSTDRRAASRPRVRVTRAGAFSAEITVSLSMRVPHDLVDVETGRPFTGREKRTARSKRLSTLRVETVFTLRSGARRLECRTVVENGANCHRLSVLFATRRKTDVWFADSAFDIVKRRIRLIDTTGWKEDARAEQVIKNFAAISDRRGGLAVITKGLNEAAARDDRERTLALTLFRAFRENLVHEITEDSQAHGSLAFEYAIAPFTPERGSAPAGLFAEAERWKMPLYSFTRAVEGDAVSPEARLIEISAPAVLSTVKVSEDGKAVIARILNPTGAPIRARVRAGFTFREASETDFLETPERPLAAARGGYVSVALGAKKVKTLRFERE
jgi:alpha-mannosidase/mannosylglycerate hydrolase